MAHTIYNRHKANVANGTHDWDAGTYRVLLTTNAYTPDPDHNFVADVTNELAGGGYARVDLATRTVVEDDANDRADAKADNTTFSGLSSTQTARYAVIYKFNTNDADSTLVAAMDLGASGVNLTTLTAITLRWDAQVANGAIWRVT